MVGLGLIKHMEEPALCTSCNQLNAICCCLCENPLKLFCDVCFAEHEKTVPKLWLHFSVPMRALNLDEIQKKRLRKRAHAFFLKEAELKNVTPSIATLQQKVNLASEHLISFVKNWRDRHFSTLDKCHSAMIARINDALAKAKETILDEAVETSEDLLERYFQTEVDMDMNPLKAEIRECEEALAKACELNISSDLSQVQEIIDKEKIIVPCEKCNALKNELDEMEKDFIWRFGTIFEEKEELQQRLSETMSDKKMIQEERNKLLKDVNKLPIEIRNLRLKIRKYIDNEESLKEELLLQSEQINTLQSQLSQGQTMRFHSTVETDLKMIDMDLQLSGRAEVKPNPQQEGRPPARFQKRLEVEKTCEVLQKESEIMQKGCTPCEESKAQHTFATQVLSESEDTGNPFPISSSQEVSTTKRRMKAVLPKLLRSNQHTKVLHPYGGHDWLENPEKL